MKLDEVTTGSAYGGIVMDGEVFERLHQTALHISSFCGLDGCVDQSFTSSHRVKEELGGRKTGIEGVLDKSFGGRIARVKSKMRKGAEMEAICNAATAYSLLSHDSN